jgi:hypothetical protein
MCARRTPLPWYRAQALSDVARYIPEQHWKTVLSEAWQAAWDCDEPYKRVAVAAWPARASIERSGSLDPSVIRSLLKEATNIENTGSKAQALYSLWQGVYPIGAQERQPVEDALIAAGLSARSWRGVDVLRQMALDVRRDDYDRALMIAHLMPECRVKRQLLRELTTSEKSYSVRHFFHHVSC